MQTYMATPDYYRDYLEHKAFKYISRKKNKKGKWVYKYPKKMTNEQREKYYAEKMADDLVDGRRNVEGGYTVLGAGKGKLRSQQSVERGTGLNRNRYYTYTHTGDSLKERSVNASDFEKAYGSAVLRKKKKKK